MYYLIITTDEECKNQKVILEGSYADICKQTCEYEDSNDIRFEFNSVISDFLNKNRGKKTSIVIVQPYKYNDELRYKRYKVLYKKDIEQFNKLLIIPNAIDKYFKIMVSFWKSLVNTNTLDNQNNSELDNEFLECSNRFKNTLSKIYGTKVDKLDWDTNDITFGTDVFPKFKQNIDIKANPNYYYEVARIVLKAFELWKKKYRKMGINPDEIFGDYIYHKMTKKERYEEEKNAITIPSNENYEDIEVFDELHNNDFKQYDGVHSKEYISIKSAIDRKEITIIQQYLELYGISGFTNSELAEIKSLMKAYNVKKR